MHLISYANLFPDQAAAETRSITVRGHAGLPDGEYGLFEAYCPDPDCDCRRVMINVVRRNRLRRGYVATISYGFDRDGEMPGPFLDSLNPQSRYAGKLLEIVKRMLETDADYVARLESHYRQVKQAGTNVTGPVRRGDTKHRPDARARKGDRGGNMDIWTDKWDERRVHGRTVVVMRRIAQDLLQLGEDDAALYAYAVKHRLTVNEAVYYLNAYEFGGDTGLHAIRNPDIIPAGVAQRAVKTIASMLDAHFQGRMPYRITDEGTAIGLYEIQERQSGDKYLFRICQFRLTLADNHWHFYWMRKFDAWWPYDPPETGRKFTLRARVHRCWKTSMGVSGADRITKSWNH